MTTTAHDDATQAAEAAAIAVPLFQQAEQAWNRADGAAFGALFAHDSEFVDIRGVHHRGDVVIGRGHQAIFDSIYAGSTVRYEVDGARSVAPSAIVAGVTATLDAPAGPLQGVNHSRLTAVIVEREGRWVITAFQNTLVAEGS